MRDAVHEPLAVDELLREVRRVEVFSRRLVDGALAGSYVAAFKGAGIEFDEVREYAPGDDPRRLDHAVSARMQRPFVRVFVDERELQLMLVVDASASMLGGPGAFGLQGMAARVVGCMALSAVRHNDRVGMLVFGDDVRSFVPPRKGSAHVMRLVRDCLALDPRGGSMGLGPALLHAEQGLKRQAVVVVISDFATTGWTQPLERLAWRHDVVAVRVAPAHDRLPPRGLLHLRDPESGRRVCVDAASPKVQAHRAREEAALSAVFAEVTARAGIDTLELRAPQRAGEDSVGPPLARLFRLRAGRRARA